MQDGTAQLRIRRLSNFAANGLPVGFEYFTINKNIRTGSLPLLGGLYSRELYADLWSWIQEQPGYLITETEWQSKSQANNGNVPFYSSGDGSTTFRVPSLKCWVKSGSEITEVGSYLEVGLPNIEGSFGVDINSTGSISGAFYVKGSARGAGGTSPNNSKAFFDASRSNSIYGNSDEVTPESIVGLYCVIAFSTISNTGNLDVQTLYNKIIELENKLENADSTPTGTILALLDDEVPEGYLPAEGAAISRTTYADLFNIIGTTETVIDPLESKKQGRTIYLLPANSTFTKPKEEAPEGYVNVWNGIVWKLIEDNRGKEYWLPEDVYNTPARVMKDLEPLPENTIFTPPEQTEEEKKNEKANSFRGNLRNIAVNAMMATLAGNGIENAKVEYQTELQSVEDEVAILVPDVFPLWDGNSVEYKKGDRVTYNNVLYKVITAHTSQESWKPDVSPSLFAKVISQIGEEIPE